MLSRIYFFLGRSSPEDTLAKAIVTNDFSLAKSVAESWYFIVTWEHIERACFSNKFDIASMLISQCNFSDDNRNYFEMVLQTHNINTIRAYKSKVAMSDLTADHLSYLCRTNNDIFFKSVIEMFPYTNLFIMPTKIMSECRSLPMIRYLVEKEPRYLEVAKVHLNHLADRDPSRKTNIMIFIDTL